MFASIQLDPQPTARRCRGWRQTQIPLQLACLSLGCVQVSPHYLLVVFAHYSDGSLTMAAGARANSECSKYILGRFAAHRKDYVLGGDETTYSNLKFRWDRLPVRIG